MSLIQASLLFLIIAIYEVNTKDSCNSQEQIRVKHYSPNECLQLNFDGNEKLNSRLGNVGLEILKENKSIFLNVSLNEIKWNRAYLKLSELNSGAILSCKSYVVGNGQLSQIIQASDRCFNLTGQNSSLDYEIEFRAQLNTDVLYKKLVFKPLHPDAFDDSISLSKRPIFTSVDVSSNYEIILKIQPLPTHYNIIYYKVEVFKEKDESDLLLDVRLLQHGTNSFEYITYNEEGYYFFKVSAISKECPEDMCMTTVSSKIYIKRKYPPLVIGIVGASFMIPFILFLFHMWTRRTQLQDESEPPKDQVFIVYNQTPETHYNIVKLLEKTLKSLGNVQLVTKINEATHIVYVCGTHIFEPDASTHKFLVIEANKTISNVEILVLAFPYSTKEIPPYLKKSLRFELMSDFGKFIHIFNCDAEYEDAPLYAELNNKLKTAQLHTEPKKIVLNMPIIIITEQSDSSDTEPKEADVLL
ncbi:uncharacterized protein LOC115874247 isoform X2 [Sitophilus oryzae]|uniref:Uncharacterized protein LOC115874247 isoform X2 n=1 Tax=Sitophilus oryzae TaxID=7048 RepID=A0A6J2X1W5_SITOR|nr:uncharacterized protein LOC115874247 isoform X2 [Sitophilus oryzae]